MNFRRIKHSLMRLSIEEKTLSIGAIMIAIGSFLPWHSMVFISGEKNILENGFSGDLGVIGFTVFLMSAISMLFLTSKHFNIPLPHFGYKKDGIILFLMSQSAFLLLLNIAIYTKRSLDYTNAEIRFGLYITLAGACLGVFAAFAQSQRNEKEEAEEFFGYEENEKSVAIKHETPMASPKPIITNAPEPNIQESFFSEDEINEEDDEDEEDDISEDLIDEEESFNEVDDETPVNKNHEIIKIKEQANYFMKEAGINASKEIKVSIDSVKKIEEKELNDDFYNDL